MFFLCWLPAFSWLIGQQTYVDAHSCMCITPIFRLIYSTSRTKEKFKENYSTSLFILHNWTIMGAWYVYECPLIIFVFPRSCRLAFNRLLNKFVHFSLSRLCTSSKNAAKSEGTLLRMYFVCIYLTICRRRGLVDRCKRVCNV